MRSRCLPGDVRDKVAQGQEVAVRQAVPARRPKILLRLPHVRLANAPTPVPLCALLFKGWTAHNGCDGQSKQQPCFGC